MAKASVEVKQGKELADKFKQISKNVENEIEQALLESALMVERDAKIKCPVDLGRLRQSISSRLVEESGKPYAEVGTNVKYGKFQEYGTGKAGASSNVSTPADYEYGNSKGIPAQPFLYPAYVENKQKILKKLAKAFQKGAGL